MNAKQLTNDLSQVRSLVKQLSGLIDNIQTNMTDAPDGDFQAYAKLLIYHGFDELDAGSTDLLTWAIKQERLERKKRE